MQIVLPFYFLLAEIPPRVPTNNGLLMPKSSNCVWLQIICVNKTTDQSICSPLTNNDILLKLVQ